MPVSFAPAADGSISGTLVVTDNDLNATATQTLNLSGTGGGSSQNSILRTEDAPTSGICAPPVITKVTPDTWFAGRTYHIRITGSNFQTNGAFCQGDYPYYSGFGVAPTRVLRSSGPPPAAAISSQ